MKLVSDKLLSFYSTSNNTRKLKWTNTTVGKRHHITCILYGTLKYKVPFSITIFHASTGQMSGIHVIEMILFPLRNMYWRHDMMIFKLVWEVVTGDGCRGGSAWVCTEGCLSPLWASSQAEAREEYLTTSLKVSALRN